jgi:hypothetical protein
LQNERPIPTSIVQSASDQLAKTERSANLAIGGCALAIVIGTLVLIAWGSERTWRIGLGLVVVGITLGALLLVIQYRVRFSQQSLQSGLGERVSYLGWVRVPDGCNFALFASGALGNPPAMVMRLPRIRPVKSGAGWVSKSATRSAAVLVDDDGTVIAYGRMRPDPDALMRWERRSMPTPWWMGGNRKNVRPSDPVASPPAP